MRKRFFCFFCTEYRAGGFKMVDMIVEKHISSSMVEVLRHYGITFSASVENLFSINATDQDLIAALNQIYQCWVNGGLKNEDLQLSFEVVRGFVLRQDFAARMKIVDSFLANLPRRRDSKSFKIHLREILNELRDEVSRRLHPRLF